MKTRLPDRERFVRRDVERMLRLDGRVLDYWEREFDTLSPGLGEAGEKIYSRRDVEVLIQIKHWLVEERLDKEEVRRRLVKYSGEDPEIPVRSEAPRRKLPLGEVRDGLREILTILEKSDTK